MRGLLYKDLIVTWKTCRMVILAALIFAVVAGMRSESLFFAVYAPIVMTATVLTTLAYDERSGWLGYADGLPYGRDTIVKSKYVMAFLCCMAAILVTAIVGVASVLFYGPVEDAVLNDVIYHRTVTLPAVAFTALEQLLVGTIQTVILLPVSLRFGVEKGRLVYIICIIVFFGLSMYLPKPGIVLGPGALMLEYLVVVAACILLWVASYFIGAAVFRKRDL